MTNLGRTLLYSLLILLSIAIIVGAVALLIHIFGVTASPDDTSDGTGTESASPPPETTDNGTTDDITDETETDAVTETDEHAPDDGVLVREYDESVIMYALYNVNTRMKDTVESDIMGLIYQGDAVTVTGETSNKWYRVDYRGYTAYIRSDLLTPDSSVASVKIEMYESPVTMYAVSNVNIRASHSTNSEIYEMIEKAASVKVTGRAANGWLRIEYGDSYAYIKEEYLSEEKPEDVPAE